MSFDGLGKREALVYIIIAMWIAMGSISIIKQLDLQNLAIYFGSLTAYAATYIWSETTRPSQKTGVLKKGPHSRREMMIYVILIIWFIGGLLAIFNSVPFKELSIYFMSLTGFVGAWIAGEKYKPEDHIIKTKSKSQDEWDLDENS